MDNGNVVEVHNLSSKCIYTFKVWQKARKSNSLYFRWTHPYICKVWLKLDEKWWTSSLLELFNIRNFATYTEWPQTELKWSTWPESTLHMESLGPRVQNFICLLYGQTFSRYCIFYDFPLTLMLKFQSATQLLKVGLLPREVIACSQCCHEV